MTRKKTLEEANLELACKSFNGMHQYQTLPGRDYFPFKIISCGKKYRLINCNAPLLEGSLARCLRQALARIESAHYYLEYQAAQKCHPFCYLPYVTRKVENAYPSD